MNVPEHIGKELLREGGIRTPRGIVARDADAAEQAARDLGGRVAIKAQIPAGKRGKSGGIAFASSADEAAEKTAALIGTEIAGHRVDSVLVESAADIASELYAAILNDGSSGAPLVLFSTEGGMDIEELSAVSPGKIVRQNVDIQRGLDEATALKITADERVAGVLRKMYERFIALDCELLEINPL